MQLSGVVVDHEAVVQMARSKTVAHGLRGLTTLGWYYRETC